MLTLKVGDYWFLLDFFFLDFFNNLYVYDLILSFKVNMSQQN